MNTIVCAVSVTDIYARFVLSWLQHGACIVMVTVHLCCHGYSTSVLSWLQYICVVMVTVQAKDPESSVAGAVQPPHV